MSDPFRKDYAFLADDPRACTHDEQMYSGALSFCRRRYARDLDGVDVAVVGVPFDTATSNRPGARFGPRAIRAASTNLAWSRAWPSPFDPFERLAVVDWGDIDFDYGHPEKVPERIEAAVAHVIDAERGAGPAALLLGGDHFTSYPSLRAHARKHGKGLSLIQFDAHCDTWIDDGERIDHGTMFHHAAREGVVDAGRSIQIGLRTTATHESDFRVIDAIEVQERGVDAVVAAIRETVGGNRCYLTFDIDCLDPAYAPRTGTPVVGGLSTHQAQSILRALAGIDFVAMDVVEVAPPYDVAQITALAAASLALDYLCLRAGTRPAPGA